MSNLSHSPSPIAPPDFLTVDQVANHLRVSVKTVRRWVQSGELIHHRFGRQLRISEIDLQAFIDAGRQP